MLSSMRFFVPFVVGRRVSSEGGMADVGENESEVGIFFEAGCTVYQVRGSGSLRACSVTILDEEVRGGNGSLSGPPHRKIRSDTRHPERDRLRQNSDMERWE